MRERGAVALAIALLIGLIPFVATFGGVVPRQATPTAPPVGCTKATATARLQPCISTFTVDGKDSSDPSWPRGISAFALFTPSSGPGVPGTVSLQLQRTPLDINGNPQGTPTGELSCAAPCVGLTTDSLVHLVIQLGPKTLHDPTKLTLESTGNVQAAAAAGQGYVADKPNMTLTLELKPTSSAWMSCVPVTKACAQGLSAGGKAAGAYSAMAYAIFSELSAKPGDKSQPDQVKGLVVTTNSQYMSPMAYSEVDLGGGLGKSKALSWTFASPHWLPDGSTVNEGWLKLWVPKDLVKKLLDPFDIDHIAVTAANFRMSASAVPDFIDLVVTPVDDPVDTHSKILGVWITTASEWHYSAPSFSLTKAPPEQLCRVPRLTDRIYNPPTTDEVTPLLDAANCTLGRVGHATNNKPAGMVVSQLPKENTRQADGYAVDIVVSDGPANTSGPCTVPDITGQLEKDAKDLLHAAGCGAQKAGDEFSDTVAKGLVTRQLTDAGTTQVHNFKVQYFVSKGASAKCQVPDVSSGNGLRKDQAEKLIKAAKCKVGAETLVISSRPVGFVVSQSIAAGTTVDKDTPVDLQISGDICVVPSVVGQSKGQAQHAIEQNKCKVGQVTKVPSDQPKDTVLTQSIAATTVVLKDTKVDLTISDGPAHKVAMPNLIGLTRAEAETALGNLALVLGSVKSDYSSRPVGIVFKQSHTVGVQVNTGTKITIWLSKGPKPAARSTKSTRFA